MENSINMITIDVVIPSFRLQSKYLLSIIGMKKPLNSKIRYIIIGDNPEAQLSNNFNDKIDNKFVLFHKNTKNLGAHGSRNVGINLSESDWILFLDDDIKPDQELLIKYTEAIRANPHEVGFFGETLFPKPFNNFTKGIIACDILTFFFLAGYYSKLKWAPTANVIIKTDVIGETRFQNIFPNNGGGEDIDFFLQINRKTKKDLICLSDAKVYHDWWYNGDRNYTRFVRWSYGDTLLHEIFPEFTYYNFPNVIESLFFGTIIIFIFSIFVLSIKPIICLILGIIIGEILVEFIRLHIYKGFSGSKFTLESVLIRASNDIGRLYMQLFVLKRLKGIFERFDHFCDGKHIKYQKSWAGIKFSSYIFFTIIILMLIN